MLMLKKQILISFNSIETTVTSLSKAAILIKITIISIKIDSDRLNSFQNTNSTQIFIFQLFEFILKKMLPAFDLVVARTLTKRGIGRANQIPWKLPIDSSFFKRITKSEDKTNICIMGRKTFESIGKPLPGRHNLVISNSSKLKIPGIQQIGSLTQALSLSKSIIQAGKQKGRVFVIGGQKIYEEAIADCRQIFETRINLQKEQCDRFFPKHDFEAKYISKVFRQNDLSFDFCQYQNPKFKESVTRQIPFARNEEYQYTDLIKKIIEFGEDKMDRTKTGTRGLFGDIMRFDLEQGFPILTTKRVFWKGVVQELFWFIKGSTNNQHLKDKKVNIWNGNGTKQYLHSIGLTNREEGDLGPVYGFQWRHWGAQYTDMHADYTNKGIDQLSWLINEIKTNPNSRRLIMSAWNVSQLKEMALPPCHVMCHFQVTNKGKLNCIMYQRSCDIGLGVPFNIASYSLLTCMIAQVCGLQRGEFIYMMGDTHIYNDHIEKLQPELNREPFPFPYLKLSPEIKNIEDFKCQHVNLQGYKSHGRIEMKMAV